MLTLYKLFHESLTDLAVSFSVFSMAVSLSSLKKFGKNKYVAMLVSKAAPSHWESPTLFMLFIEESGAITGFVATHAAIASFSECIVGCIYEFDVSGRCVRHSHICRRFGVRSLQEVVTKYQCKVNVSSSSWPMVYPYVFADWHNFNELKPKAFVDVIGIVCAQPRLDTNSSIRRLPVRLRSGNFVQCVILLGDSARIQVKVGDVLACSCLQVREWRSERSLQTSWLSAIEINPSLRDGVPEVEDPDDKQPKKKAMRFSLYSPISLAEAKRIGQLRVADAQALKTTAVHNGMIRGRLKKLEQDFFDNDVPVVGHESSEKMCWRTILSDDSDEVEVKVWDSPCYELFGVTASGLRKLWEAGNEDASQQHGILKQLNQDTDHIFDCTISIDVWSPAPRTEFRMQVNVNSLEVFDV